MTKYYIIPLLSVLSFSTSFGAQPDGDRGISNFTVERDVELQADSVKVKDQKDFKIYDEAGKKIYSRPNYKLTTEVKGNTFRAVEVSVSEEENRTNWIRMVELENGQPKSFTRCDAGAMSEEDLSVAQKATGANNFVLEGCATATPKVCQTFAMYFGSAANAYKQVAACEGVKRVGEQLQSAMNTDEYKRTNKANTSDMSNVFISLMQPKMLDGQKVKNSVKAPSSASLQDSDNLLSLAKACSDLDNLSTEKYFQKKEVRDLGYKRIKASRFDKTNPPAAPQKAPRIDPNAAAK